MEVIIILIIVVLIFNRVCVNIREFLYLKGLKLVYLISLDE